MKACVVGGYSQAAEYAAGFCVFLEKLSWQASVHRQLTIFNVDFVSVIYCAFSHVGMMKSC